MPTIPVIMLTNLVTNDQENTFSSWLTQKKEAYAQIFDVGILMPRAVCYWSEGLFFPPAFPNRH